MTEPVTPDRGHVATWQEKLQDYCRASQLPNPVYNILSDRRGGRTAWSSTVTISTLSPPNSQTVQARFWYDGQHVNNAKEDVAEVALRIVTAGSPTNSNASSGNWPRSGSAGSPTSDQGGMGASWPRSPPSARR